MGENSIRWFQENGLNRHDAMACKRFRRSQLYASSRFESSEELPHCTSTYNESPGYQQNHGSAFHNLFVKLQASETRQADCCRTVFFHSFVQTNAAPSGIASIPQENLLSQFSVPRLLRLR